MENSLNSAISLIGVDALLQEAIASSRLFIEIAFNRISFAILNNQSQTYKAFESYSLAEDNDMNDTIQTIDKICHQSKLIKNDFLSTNILYCGYKSTLVPNALFDIKTPELYLKYIYNVDKDENIYYDNLTITNAVNVYTIKNLLNSKIKSLFPFAKISHSYTSLIENLLYQFNNTNENKLVLHVQQKNMQIINIHNNQLLFFNTFKYKTKEDLIYYLLFAMQQLHLSPETQELLILGEIDKNSSLTEIIYRYIKNPIFGEKSNMYKFDVVFDEIPPHHYYNLLNFHL